MLKQDDKKGRKFADFAPALDEEPVFERPGDGRWDQAPQVDKFKLGPHAPTGSWADGRSVFGMESKGGLGFLDPGSYALSEHNSHMMQSHGSPVGVMQSASADLSRDFAISDHGGGGGGGGGGSGGGSSGGSGGGSSGASANFAG